MRLKHENRRFWEFSYSHTHWESSNYTYAYKTSDGIRHEAVMEAPSREEVFATLRERGIRAIKVVAADGSKANGEVQAARASWFALRGSWVLLGVLALTVVGIGIAFRAGEVRGTKHEPRSTRHEASSTNFLTDTTRRQVIGDAAVIEKGIRTGWVDVFAHEGDRFLASFAIPGVKAGVESTSIAALEACLSEKVEKVGGESGSTKHEAESRSIEAQQIMAMVEGMKREARAYLAAGGTAVEYGKRLVERQDAEIAIFKRVESEILTAQKTLPEADFTNLYEQRNDELRNLGIRPITLPD